MGSNPTCQLHKLRPLSLSFAICEGDRLQHLSQCLVKLSGIRSVKAPRRLPVPSGRAGLGHEVRFLSCVREFVWL